VAPVELSEEVLDQKGKVLDSRPQRRHPEHDLAHAVGRAVLSSTESQR
jgi:hypothetical protein